MTILYLTRHGQTEWNTQRRMQGWNDSPLTAQGVQQAQWLAQSLQQVEWQAIYSSPSGRAVRTAEILRGEGPVDIITDLRLREMGFGEWEGRVIPELEEEYPDIMHALWRDPARYVPLSGESYSQVRERVLEALEHIVRQHPAGNVLIITHTVVLKLLMAYFEERPIDKLWELPFIHPTSLSVVEVDEKAHRIVMHGDVSHFQE